MHVRKILVFVIIPEAKDPSQQPRICAHLVKCQSQLSSLLGPYGRPRGADGGSNITCQLHMQMFGPARCTYDIQPTNLSAVVHTTMLA